MTSGKPMDDLLTLLLLALIVVLAKALFDADGGDGGKFSRLPVPLN
jgi:hypothetical protein